MGAVGAVGKTAQVAMLEQLALAGVTYIFGNPGTVEQGFLDAMRHVPELQYILTLQESITVAVADGYARAARAPAVVQLHSSVGLGNALGMIYQALRGHTPMVILAGEAGLKYDGLDGYLAADLAGMARPVTKWSTRVVDAGSLLRVIRRALKLAMTPPFGPVFVALPMDVLEAPACEVPVAQPSLTYGAAPERETVLEMATTLLRAERPLFVVGDGVAFSGAQAALTGLAAAVGAEVWGAESSEVNIAMDHPLYRGLLGFMNGEVSRTVTSGADVVLICGTAVFQEVFPVVSGAFNPDARILHISACPDDIAKNYPAHIGVVADPRGTLEALLAAVQSAMTEPARLKVEARTQRISQLIQTERARIMARDLAEEGLAPRFLSRLAALLPADSILLEEGVSHTQMILRHLAASRPGSFYAARGGALGNGIPGPLGIQLARPDATVIGITGDGGCMYTAQALWTAAHHQIPARFVVLNNRRYRILENNLQKYWSTHQQPSWAPLPFFDLSQPAIQFTQLAQSLGVAAGQLADDRHIDNAIHALLRHPGPYLLEVLV